MKCVENIPASKEEAMTDITAKSRRQFLSYLAASPLAGALSGINLAHAADVVSSPADAIDIFDLEATASGNIPMAHWGYLATGVNGDSTLRANRTAFEKYFLRSRRLIDVGNVDTSVEILGTRWPTPIILAPLGSQKAFHAEGEIASARAARARTAVEDVAEARDAPIWFQLYTMGGWSGVKARLRRAEAAGCPVVVLTVDLAGGTSARHTLRRAIKKDTRDCAVCHEGDGVAAQGKPMLDGMDNDAEVNLTWEFLDRLKQETTMKVFVKGIVTAEDAERSLEHGVDGIIVSNHGGRADESGRGSIDSLAEVASAVRGRTTLDRASSMSDSQALLSAKCLRARGIAE